MNIEHFPDKYNSVPQANTFVKVFFQAKSTVVRGWQCQAGVCHQFWLCSCTVAFLSAEHEYVTAIPMEIGN